MTLLTLLSFLFHLGGGGIIDGYSDRLSVFPGDSVVLYLNAAQKMSDQPVRLFDLNGKEVARFVMPVFPQENPRGKAYENGFRYEKTATVLIPEIPSGVYLWENVVPLVIKTRNPKILVLYPSNTENAYASSGGKSLYDYNSEDRKKAVKLSFQRPIPLPKHAEAFLRWMVKQNFQDVGYISDIDMDEYSEIKKASLIIIPGHSEYWTLTARQNFDRFVAGGKNALILSGNTMWWQVRYNKERDQMICYKSAEDDKVKSTKLKTTRWNDPTLGYPITRSIGVEFPLAGYGLKADNGWDGFKILTESPLLENTGLKKGDVLACPSDEYDGAPLLGFNEQGVPVLNRAALGFEKIELVGFDYATWSGTQGVATWIVFKATKKSGIVINTATTDWCSANGLGNNPLIKTITLNMINKLLKKENVFSPDPEKSMPLLAN